jgi:hypothetical protein
MLDHREHVAALFEAALHLDPGKRSAYLDRACGDNGSPRREVEELLRADAAAGASRAPESMFEDIHNMYPRQSPKRMMGMKKSCLGPARTVRTNLLHVRGLGDQQE